MEAVADVPNKIMNTYPIFSSDRERMFAFEIENTYISIPTMALLLAEVKEVTDIRIRKMFSSSCDVHIQFKYKGEVYIVWEPYGDSSRYWIGPDQDNDATDIANIEEVFKHYHPPFYRLILGDIISLRFITRFWKCC